MSRASANDKGSGQERSKKSKGRQKGLVAALLAGVVVLAAGIFITHNIRAVPDKVTGLAADTCYSQVNLSWDQAAHADGYVIYRLDGSEKVKVGETEGAESISWAYEDFDHNSDAVFTVAGTNSKSGKGEGEESDAVTASYDPDGLAQKIPVIAYHKIVRDSEVVSDAGMKTGLIVKESVFDEEMKYLHDNGFTTLTLDEFNEWHQGKKEFPEKSVLVTFDDGFYGVYYVAYPILKKYNQAGTVFCIGKNTGGVTAEYTPEEDEGDQYIKEDVIQKVREEYPRFEFGSHTFDMHNRKNGKKPAVSYTYEQIMEDCDKQAQFGFDYLAYPWGTYSETMQSVLKDAGYKMAFAYGPFFYAYRSDDPYAVNRIKISGLMPMDEFIGIVNQEDTEYDNPDAPEEAGQ